MQRDDEVIISKKCRIYLVAHQVILVTYEGEGNDTNKAINDFKSLINNIKIEAPKDGFLFNQNDLLKHN